MKQPRKIPGILIYLLILFFSVIGFVYALQLNASVTQGNQTVYAGGSNSKDGVEVSKTIEETNLENYFDITLKVKTSHKIEEVMRDQDLAIVIVMDVSNTMIQYNIDGTQNEFGKDLGNGKYNPDYVAGKSGDKTRYATAITAGENFIKEFANYSLNTNDDTIRKIGFVAFNSNAKKISGLTNCKTTSDATSLISKMKTETEKIVEVNRYLVKKDRFTNIEAGIKMAHDMLGETGEVDNKIIIFLSDGLPTTYISTNYDGYDTYTTGTTSEEGVFHNEILNKKCSYGTSYSDRAAIRARRAATNAKNSGITIYSVGTGIEKQTTVPEYMETDKGRDFSVVDTDKVETFETGNSTEDFKTWLKNKIGSGHYYNASDKNSLENAYLEIFKQIKDKIESSAQATWVAEDPMGVDGDVESIEFVGFLDDTNALQNSLNIKNENQSDTATISNNKINWDLKNSKYETSTGEDNTTYYTYEVKYRVRIQNELDAFNLTKVYDTNGKTTLTYVTRNNGVLSDNKEIDFPIPSVVAYLGELEFTKKNASFDVIESGALAGAKFTLTHSSNCPCLVESMTNHKHMSEDQSYTATSGTDGKVSFENIPSGHKYILKEVTAPDNYIASSKQYSVTVAYGVTTGGPDDGVVENTIQKGNLKISKEVQGNKDYKGEFEFKIVITYNNTTLTGSYNYTLYDASTKKETTGNLKLTDTFKLKDGDYIIIEGLPIGSKYKITELTTNGYTVKNKINDGDTQTGATASCSSDSCSINNGGTQTVEFYNIAGYILPATGNSGMLILVIIASLLLIVPIINIGYMFYKSRKEGKLTS